MKKIITVFALALICSGAYAQFNKGRILAGGSVAFSATTGKAKSDNATNTYGHYTSISVSPDVGYFVIDNLAVGAALDISSNTFKGDGADDSKHTTTNFTLAPFVRYYLDPGIFFQAQVGFGSGAEKDKNDGSNTTTTTKHGIFGYGLFAGYAYFLNDNVAIEPMIGYVSNTDKYSDPDIKDITSGIAFRIGLQVYLGARN